MTQSDSDASSGESSNTAAHGDMDSLNFFGSARDHENATATTADDSTVGGLRETADAEQSSDASDASAESADEPSDGINEGQIRRVEIGGLRQ